MERFNSKAMLTSPGTQHNKKMNRRERMKDPKQEREKTMSKGKYRREDNADFWKVGRVPVSHGGGVGCWETAEVGWLIDCSDLRAPSQLYVSLLMDFTFSVSLTHKSEPSALLNKSIRGILSSDKSQWFTPLATTSLSKPAVYWHSAGLCWVIPKIATDSIDCLH